MISTRTRLFLATATFAGGLLTGGIVDRALVGAPAWRVLGPDTWVQYSLHADFGRGFIAYPLEAIGAAVLIIAATVSFHFDRTSQRHIRSLLYLAAAFSLTGLLITLKAAPILLSLRADSSVSPALAFAEFNLWGLLLRGAVDLVAFVCEIFALAALRGPTEM